jgi:hypothetical protein
LGLCMVIVKVRVYAYFLSPFILNAMEGFEDCMLLRAQSHVPELRLLCSISSETVANKPNVTRIPLSLLTQ